MLPYDIAKWEVVRVFCKDLLPPHDKFCICICPKTGLFLYVNSGLPAGRKARDVALEVRNFEANFLHKTSYIDTTRLEPINTDARVIEALKDPGRRLGQISPSLKKRIIAAVADHGALPVGLEDLVLAGEALS
ncbi:hypothetical protein EOA79_04525 [Mesorhizobium sp. M1A.F.Ca.IN.020.03.2.1]|uniref:hypothetical protein n=1 Tax=Mesorhizobium sp. M1A.F.Ca.IN.020.03.2.1 TaxID=2496769 RepID=UPI000FD585E0|nr:hypothetical protein [Mesorhizobium sp. M1A.F.Ca.IN.020.03.2.1]RUV07436.1 hypothetical protein EOA79_04525 [Mesorhizobium sp. M1A.F.Ca.IN.020.03.2.1]